MSGIGFGSMFGLNVRLVDEVELKALLERAKREGAMDVGDATRTDYNMVIDEKRGILYANQSAWDKLRAEIPERPERGAEKGGG